MDLLALEHVALAGSYFTVGFSQAFLGTPLQIYLVSVRDCAPALVNTMTILTTVPWSFKLLYGLCSDAYPIASRRRAPYMTMGYSLFVVACLSYAVTRATDLRLLALVLFVSTVGVIWADVMGDALVVERSRMHEDGESRGQLQSSCYALRFAGSVFGCVGGALLFNKDTWGWGLDFSEIMLVYAATPLCFVLPFLYWLEEEKVKRAPRTAGSSGGPGSGSTVFSPVGKAAAAAPNYASIQSDEAEDEEAEEVEAAVAAAVATASIIERPGAAEGKKAPAAAVGVVVVEPVTVQLQALWAMVQLRSVWKPMIFVWIYNALQVPNIAWTSFLQLSLGFSSITLGMLATGGALMTVLGILAFKKWFFHASWRWIYVWTTVLVAVFSAMQVLLILGYVPPLLGAMGDNVLSQFVSGISFLPLTIMYQALCPPGCEGASFALLTTIGNVSMVLSSDLGQFVASFFDVSNHAMREHEYTGLWQLTLLTSVLSIVPLALIGLLPHSHQEVEILHGTERSAIGGLCLLALLAGSVTWVLYDASVTVLAVQ